MSRRAARWIAWSAVVLSFVFTSTGLVLQGLAGRTTFTLSMAFLVEASVVAGSWVVIGALIVSKQPRNVIGWMLLGALIAWAPQMLAGGMVAISLERGLGWFPGYDLAALLLTVTGAPFALFGITMLLLLFPNGRLPSPRWAAVAWAAVVGAAAHLITAAQAHGVVDVGFGLTSPLAQTQERWMAIEPIYQSALGLSLLASFAAAVSLLLRFRRSKGVERQQLKWFVYAAAPVIVSFAVNSLVPVDLDNPLLLMSSIALIVSFLGLAVAIAFSILRYRLYDIDLIINRSLVYGALTIALALIYYASVVFLQNSIRLTTGQESPIAIVASTLIIYALFQPLRRRLQGFVDRRFYRTRYDAARMLERFGSTLSEAVEIEAQVDLLFEVVDESVQPAHASLWMRSQRSSVDDRGR